MPNRDNAKIIKIILGALVVLAAIGLGLALNRPSVVANRNQQLHQGRIHFALRGALLLRDRMHTASMQFSAIRVMGDDGPICYTFRLPGSAQDEFAVLNDDNLVESRQPSFAPLWQQACLDKPGEDVTADVAQGLEQHDNPSSH